MPEPLKRLENQVGHRTKAEKSRRERAEESVRRGTRINMRAPGWLSEEAREVFEKTKKRMRGLEVLDTADIDVLALYADAVCQYRRGQKTVEIFTQLLAAMAKERAGEGSGKYDGEPGEEKDLKRMMERAEKAELMMLQWSRVVLSYAEKLGISANARARLARKKALAEQPDELDELLNEFAGAASRGMAR